MSSTTSTFFDAGQEWGTDAPVLLVLDTGLDIGSLHRGAVGILQASLQLERVGHAVGRSRHRVGQFGLRDARRVVPIEHSLAQDDRVVRAQLGRLGDVERHDRAGSGDLDVLDGRACCGGCDADAAALAGAVAAVDGAADAAALGTATLAAALGAVDVVAVLQPAAIRLTRTRLAPARVVARRPHTISHETLLLRMGSVRSNPAVHDGAPLHPCPPFVSLCDTKVHAECSKYGLCRSRVNRRVSPALDAYATDRSTRPGGSQ